MLPVGTEITPQYGKTMRLPARGEQADLKARKKLFLGILRSTRRSSQCHGLVRCIFAISDTKGDQTQIQIIQCQKTAKKSPLANAKLSVLCANWQTLQVSAYSYNYSFKNKKTEKKFFWPNFSIF